MSDVTVISTPDAPLSEKVLQLVQSVIGLAGLIGINVPPILQNLQVEQQIVSALLIVGSLAWAAYHRLVTKPAELHATAVASARAAVPRRAIL